VKLRYFEERRPLGRFTMHFTPLPFRSSLKEHEKQASELLKAWQAEINHVDRPRTGFDPADV
jgi:hypothetical protein